MERRLLVLPVAWGLYGVLLILGIQYLFGSVANNIPYGPNDKPIGGSFLPLLFFNVSAILGIVMATLYSVGYWKLNITSVKSRVELGSVGAFLASGFLVWYSPVFFFIGVAAVVALMATNIE